MPRERTAHPPAQEEPQNSLEKRIEEEEGLIGASLVEREEDDAPSIDVVIEDDSAPESGPLQKGRAAIQRFAKLSPESPGVYRMVDASGTVLYVGKAKNIRKRVMSYARPEGHSNRIARMIAATATMEFVTTGTEPEALLLEANLIKRFRPFYNVLLRDDKSFPYILLTSGHPAPAIAKHRGARNRPGDFFGPFASAGSVNRTITALERAFFLRSCSDSVYESRTRPCLLFQIKRCSAPCTGEIGLEEYNRLVEQARDFLCGKSSAIKERLLSEMHTASDAQDYEKAAVIRDRMAALSLIQSQHGVHPRNIEEADVFAIFQQGGINCVQSFFIRNHQNWGNRAHFPRADKSLEAGEVLGAFLAQFYDGKPIPRQIILSHEVPDQRVLAEAFSTRAERKVEIVVPKRGEKSELVDHATRNAREAIERQLAETSSQLRLLKGLAETFGLPGTPKRIEVYDNSHIMGTNAVGAMIVAGPEGFAKSQYRKFNIKSADTKPGDDIGMMREVLRRRFRRLVEENPREQNGAAQADAGASETPWPDLVVVDGGLPQLNAAREIMTEVGVNDVPLLAVAKGMDRDAGRELFHIAGREPFRLPPRDPVLYFIERLRDEAHRFAIGSHRTRRSKDIGTTGLQEIPGVGPARKRALLHHFGTLKAIGQASLSDLETVPGIDARLAKAVYDYFHAGG
ncbi:MAG TPA: excinuclease ABC subunit UvrC [Xanthobacteraceae bacterium]|nr:excinuclease ABC subunit UvrC [Xanthobacteraceae bacterium]